jgi:hypothetical protein
VTSPEDHPRAAECWEAAKRLGELAAIEQRAVWEANETYRAEHVVEVASQVAACLREHGRDEQVIDAAWDAILDEPVEFWGEIREGRQPPLDM